MRKTQIPNWIFQSPLHGVRLHSDGIEASLDSEHAFSLRLGFPKEIEPTTVKTLWHQTDRGDRYTSEIDLYEEPMRKLLQIACEGKGVLEYKNNDINITWQSKGTSFEHYLQTVGLSLWLETRGVLCIHANAIATDTGVIGLIAPSQTGKTTLTTALAVRGMALMSDDMMAIHKQNEEWRVYPAWPHLRMWPDVAEYFTKSPTSLKRVHSRFAKRIAKPDEIDGLNYVEKSGLLKRLYLLKRVDDQSVNVSIERLTANESIVTLLQNSMLADAYRPLGLESGRLMTLATLLDKVSVKRIVYPSGKSHLAKVCKCIEEDQQDLQ